MKIVTDYKVLVELLDRMSLVVSSKGLQDNFKVVTFFVKDGVLKALGSDFSVFSLYDVEGSYDLEGEENPYMVVSIRELSNTLSKFTSLTRTVVDHIELATQQKGIVMKVIETVKDEDKSKDNSTAFKSGDTMETKFKLVRNNENSAIIREIPNLVLPEGAVSVPGKDFKKYLDYMYTQLARSKTVSMMHFDDNLVYATMNKIYGVSMENILDTSIFSEISLSTYVINYLKYIISAEEDFEIFKEVDVQKIPNVGIPESEWVTNKKIVLYIKTKDTITKIKTIDNSKSVNTLDFTQNDRNRIVLDKPYFVDILKRFEMEDFVHITVILENNGVETKGTCVLGTQRIKQEIPIHEAYGEGEFNFIVTAKTLSSMVFSHIKEDVDCDKKDIDTLLMSFEMNTGSKNTMGLMCQDNTGNWKTRYPNTTIKTAPKFDF